jgi:hypothetical protein
MKKQTAIDWLVEQVKSKENQKSFSILQWLKIIEKAKEMEKEQIEDAWDKRCSYGVVSQTWHIETKNGEQYYNETYGDNK